MDQLDSTRFELVYHSIGNPIRLESNSIDLIAPIASYDEGLVMKTAETDWWELNLVISLDILDISPWWNAKLDNIEINGLLTSD